VSVFSNVSSGSTGLGRKRSLLGLRKDRHSEDGSVKSIPYEQTQARAAPLPLANMFAPPASSRQQGQGPTRVQKLNPGLGLDIGIPGDYGAAAPAGIVSPPPTPLSPSATGPGKKDSWFAGLFNWKPATFTLMSTENLSETLGEAVRRLQSFGVRVAMDESLDAHHTTLKCAVTEYRDSGGLVTPAKPLRFRVEFSILPVGSTTNSPYLGLGLSLHGANIDANGLPSPALSTHSRSSASTNAVFATSMQVIQEKGALSTFKLVHGRLRREWTLDMSSAII
jgi:hypothetical protein